MSIANTKTVEEFVNFIREKVQSSNKAWWEVAQAFAEARAMYGADSDAFKRLCKETKFSKSKASKLATIASSERLRKYAVQLSAVHSWATLYAISILSDENFAKLKALFKLDDKAAAPAFITQAEVEAIHKEKSEKSFFKNYAIVQIDEEALKGGLVTGDDMEKLWNLMNEIEAICSYVRVTRTEIDQKESLKQMARVEDKVKQITRRKFIEAIKATLDRNNKHKGEKQETFERRCLPMSRSELMVEFQMNAKEAFAKLGAEYSIAAIYKEAESEVLTASIKVSERYAAKVLKRVSAPVDNRELKEAA